MNLKSSLLFSFLLAQGLYGTQCLSQKQKQTEIKGSLQGSYNGPVYLQRLIDNKPVVLDSVILSGKNEMQSFQFRTDRPRVDYYRLVLKDQQGLLFAIDSAASKIEFTSQVENFGVNYVVTGSESSSAIAQFTHKEWRVKTTMDSLNVVGTAKPELRNQLSVEANKLDADFRKYRTEFIEKNLNNAAVLLPIRYINAQQEPELFGKIAAAVRKSMKGNYYQLQIEQQMRGMLLTGSEAPDLSFNNPDGVPMKLSDLRGNVVLIDFWASWCGPCRRENPAVVALYNKYKDKGFTIYSVSLDQSYDKWVQAIQADGLIWPNHVSDLKGWQSEPAALYGVKSIPSTVLLDKEGKVIATKLRGQQLEMKLIEIFGF